MSRTSVVLSMFASIGVACVVACSGGGVDRPPPAGTDGTTSTSSGGADADSGSATTTTTPPKKQRDAGSTEPPDGGWNTSPDGGLVCLATGVSDGLTADCSQTYTCPVAPYVSITRTVSCKQGVCTCTADDAPSSTFVGPAPCPVQGAGNAIYQQLRSGCGWP